VLSPQEWASIQIVRDWLGLFQLATTRLSSRDLTTISSVFAVFLGLQAHVRSLLSNLSGSLPRELTAGLIGAHEKLAEYLTKLDACPYYMWAACEFLDLFSVFPISHDLLAVLDPRIRLSGVLQAVVHDPRLHEDVLVSKAKFDAHFLSHYSTGTTSSSSTTPSTNQDPFFSIFASAQPSVSAPRKELEQFFALPPEGFDGPDPVQWWASRTSQFPCLSRMARDVFSISGKNLTRSSFGCF
jgi:hypothetical protein